jgi:protein TonB
MSVATLEGDAYPRTRMNRIALRPLLPATASVLIHLGIAGMVLLAAGFEPARMPVLLAELVVAEPPPIVEPRQAPTPVVRDRRPITPPKLIPTPPPPAVHPPTPPRPEPDPPKPVMPEPPRVVAPEPPPAATPEPDQPRAAPSEPVPTPAPAPAVSPSGPVIGPSATAVPDAGGATFTLPPPPAQPPAAGASPSSARAPAVVALPSESVTQRAIPRGGYQYRPPYPAAPRNLGIQGTALLHVLVADDGRVAQVVIKQSAGHADLDRAAADAVRRWRFEPARRGTEPVEMWVQLPFEFRLR